MSPSHKSAVALQEAVQHIQQRDHMSRQDVDALLQAWGHQLRIAQAEDALAIWEYGGIAAVTLLVAIAAEAWWHRKHGGTLQPGFRGGAMMGLLVSMTALFPLGWLAARALASGAIKCMARRCHGTEFTDLLGQRHVPSQHFLSMTFDAPAFWIVYVQLSLLIVIALMALFSCLRALRHWRELD